MRVQNGDKSSKFNTAARNAAAKLRKLVPALLGGSSKSVAENAAWAEVPHQKNSVRKRLIGPYKHAARSLRQFKEKRHERKTILPQLQDQPPTSSDNLAEERGGDQNLRNDQESINDNENTDRRMQTALMDTLATDANAQTRRRFTSPPPPRHDVSDPDEYQTDPVTNVGPGVSTSSLPSPGLLGPHLLDMAPDRFARDRLTSVDG